MVPEDHEIGLPDTICLRPSRRDIGVCVLNRSVYVHLLNDHVEENPLPHGCGVREVSVICIENFIWNTVPVRDNHGSIFQLWNAGAELDVAYIPHLHKQGHFTGLRDFGH